MSARKSLALVAALAALALPACGGDDDGDEGGGEALSTEQYDEQADAALQRMADLSELSAPLANPESVEQYVTGVREITTTIEGTADELAALEPPESVAALHDALVGALDAYGAAFTPVADAAEAGDNAALQSEAESLRAAALEFQQTASDLAQQFGEEGIELESLG